MGTVSHCGGGGLSYRVVVDHLRDGVEWSAELSQDVLATSSELDPHVHEPVAAPAHHSRVSIEHLILVSPA